MTDETTTQFVARRKKELLAQISVLEGQLNPKKIELAQLESIEGSLADGDMTPGRIARENAISRSLEAAAVIAPSASGDDAGKTLAAMIASLTPEAITNLTPEAKSGLVEMLSDFQEKIQRFDDKLARWAAGRMTIKQMVIQALIDHFPDGATATEIREYIRDGYGRDVDPSSLRPQMHRLKFNGALFQDAATDRWDLHASIRQNPHRSIEGFDMVVDEPEGVTDEQLIEAKIIPPGATSIKRRF